MHRREQRDMLSQHDYESGRREYNMHLKGGGFFHDFK